MAKCCGPRAFIKKIKVKDEEIPVIALEPIMFLVFNLNLYDDKLIINELMKEIEEMGNKIPEDNRKEFESSLMIEYRIFVEKIESDRKKRIKI